MSVEIITKIPLWYYILCLAFSALLSYLLYQINPFGDEINRQSWLYKTLIVLRFLTLSIVSFLLLSPLIKSNNSRLEKPLLIVAKDNSQSLIAKTDSNELKKQLENFTDQLNSKLGDKFNFRNYTFDATLNESDEIDFNGKQTNIGKLFSSIDERHGSENIGAIILMSDGNYNAGSNPIYSSERVKAPIFSILLGDTIQQKDLLISSLNYNKTVFKGNTFPIEVNIKSYGLAGKQSILTVSQNGKTLAQSNVIINKNDFITKLNFQIEAPKEGVYVYDIKLNSLDGELSEDNNSSSIIIEVLEGKQKVLLVFASAHPDLAAIKSALETNNSYDLEIKSVDVNISPENYDLLILHGLPSLERNAASILNIAEQKQIPLLFIQTQQTAALLANRAGSPIIIQPGRANANDVSPIIDENFSLFNISEDLKGIIKKLSPLKSIYGEYSLSNGAVVLFNQQIGSVITKNPLMAFSEINNRRIGTLAGEGIWRWKLINYQIKENHDAFNEFVNKTVQYLSAKTDKRKFRVYTEKPRFSENERIILRGELFNDANELNNQPDVNVGIKKSDGLSYDFKMSKSGNSYYLDAGFLNPGIYNYRADTKIGTRSESVNGSFIIEAVNLELTETKANHNLMRTIAYQSGASSFYLNEVDSLVEQILSNENIKPIRYQESKLDDLINKWWLFFLILILISTEWFIRKYRGAY